MIRAIIWKELREQGLIGLTLVVLGSAVLAGVAALTDPPGPMPSGVDVIRALGPGRLATLMLAVTAGMVCGGAVFAAEREAGTMAFLESLPASRWRVWRGKFLAGLGLAAAQVLLLVGVAAGLGLVPTRGWAGNVFVSALLAFVWGMFGSTAARTTLGSVGLAIPAASLTAFLAAIPVLVLFQTPGSHAPRPAGAYLFLACMFAAPVGLSAWLFTAPDRSRAADGRAARPRLGVGALVWLAARQLRPTGVVLSAFAVLAGLCLLAPGVPPFAAWPALALAAGVLAGVTTFADEQTRRGARFWGEQRLPVGRVWAVKVGVHLLLCLWLLLLLAAPLIIRAQATGGGGGFRGHTTLASVFGSLLFDELGRQGWKYLLAPAAYGFVAGHVCGLVFRKLVVACGVAGIIGGVGAAAWGPSLLAGGARYWQLLLPPALALATARLLVPAWSADRLVSRRPVLTLAGGGLAAALALAGGLAYRVLEVPDRPDGEADLAFVAGLPSFDVNAAGRDFRTGAERYARLAATLAPEFDRLAPAPPGGRRVRAEELVEEAVRRGWPATADPALGTWLDRLFAPAEGEAAWHALAAEAATQPVGVYEYPQMVLTGGAGGMTWENARRMGVALLARGLQRTAAGDPAAFLPPFRTALALARTMRNGAGVNGLGAATEVERTALLALDAWLDWLPAPEWWHDRLPPEADPGLLRAALAALDEGDAETPFDPAPHFLAERHVLREAMKAPGQWLPQLLAPPGAGPDDSSRETDLVGLAWTTPWERERTRRLLGLGFESGRGGNYGLIAGRPGAGFLVVRTRTPIELTELDRLLRTTRRVALLKIALRLFRTDRGAYPDGNRADPLAVLVEAGYLRRLPADPYAPTRGFGYRVSPGEWLRVPERAPGERAWPGERLGTPGGVPLGLRLSPGQPVLWSVGPDGTDQGGRNPPGYTSVAPGRPDDIVFLVPFDPWP